MDIEFHFYLTHIICRNAGFSADESFKIAYASQYLDDNTSKYRVDCGSLGYFENEISQTIDITLPQQDLKLIYSLFHFIPGGPDALAGNYFATNGTDVSVTIAGSQNAAFLLNDALATGDLYRIGIAVHGFVDTWAHQYFVGSKDGLNARSSPLAAVIPNICHADYGHVPDMIRIQWIDDRLVSNLKNVDNNARFLSAAEALFLALYKFKNPSASDPVIASRWIPLKAQISQAISGGDKYTRIQAYKMICHDLTRGRYRYDKDYWRQEAMTEAWPEQPKYYLGFSDFPQSDWWLFQLAVMAHKQVANQRLQPYL